jgi:hypothetical protein
LKRRVDGGTVGFANIGYRSHLEVLAAVIDENHIFLGERRVIDDLIHDVFIMNSLERCNMVDIEFDGGLDASESESEGWKPSCFKMGEW